MDDEVVRRAERDLASAEATVRRLEGQLEDARTKAVKLAHFLEMARLYLPTREAAPHSPRASGGASGTAVRAVIEILREVGKPIRTRELVERLKGLGIALGGDPDREVVNLSGYLSRSAELVNDRALGWSLKTWATAGSLGADAPPSPASETAPGSTAEPRRAVAVLLRDRSGQALEFSTGDAPGGLDDRQAAGSRDDQRNVASGGSDRSSPFGRSLPTNSAVDLDDDIPF